MEAQCATMQRFQNKIPLEKKRTQIYSWSAKYVTRNAEENGKTNQFVLSKTPRGETNEMQRFPQLERSKATNRTPLRED